MDVKEKPLCQYGAQCYRKNPSHFESFCHFKEKETKISISDELPLKKKKSDESSLRIDRNLKFIKSQSKFKQTTLHFGNISNEKETKKIQKKKVHSKPSIRKNLTKLEPAKKQNQSNEIFSSSSHDYEQASNLMDAEDSNNSDTLQSTSWVFIKNISIESELKAPFSDFKENTYMEAIKNLFLVEMPLDFYSFYQFCKSINIENPLKALQSYELQLVGPYDILSGKTEYLVNKEFILCHWRFYFDPPEFQTVLASNSEFHIGYWRDDPKELPVFLASNNSEKNCVFKVEGENIFASVWFYLEEYNKKCDPVKKTKLHKLKTSLSIWANKHGFSLQRKSNKIIARQKKTVSKTFHKAGIVVPIEPKTEVGYRPLLETEANLKKICNLIMAANDEKERETLWENLQPLITAANIANDECDFGNGLELGIDLFCMGSPVFHESVAHLLTTAYALLDRPAFQEIIKAHLKNRKKGRDLSVL